MKIPAALVKAARASLVIWTFSGRTFLIIRLTQAVIIVCLNDVRNDFTECNGNIQIQVEQRWWLKSHLKGLFKSRIVFHVSIQQYWSPQCRILKSIPCGGSNSGVFVLPVEDFSSAIFDKIWPTNSNATIFLHAYDHNEVHDEGNLELTTKANWSTLQS